MDRCDRMRRATGGMNDAARTAAAVLETARLELVPGTADRLRAELSGPRALEHALGARVPASWPPELFDEAAIRFTLAALEHQPESAAWGVHYFVLRAGAEGAAARTVVGVGGFKGPPTAGAVEIGYSILPEYRRRGLATEAVRALLAHAFADARVERVIAETLPELGSSIGVLDKVRMRLIGAGSEEGAIRFELLRAEYARTPMRIELSSARALLPEGAPDRSVALFRHGTLLVKLYAPRGHDPQTPHARDEVYFVASGAGEFFDGARRVRFGPGDFLFAPAGTPHRFENFTDDFFVWVMYYGPEGGEGR